MAARDTVHRNLALEAVRLGNYFAEDQAEVLAYIREQYNDLLADKKRQEQEKEMLSRPNALTRLYTVDELLSKRHEEDGYDIWADPDEIPEADGTSTAVGSAVSQNTLDQGNHEVNSILPDSKQPQSCDSVSGVADQLVRLQTRIDAAAPSSSCPRAEELVDLLELCANAREAAAAVFCYERLESYYSAEDRHSKGQAGRQMPPLATMERCFNALKVLLRPNPAGFQEQLKGPWLGPRKRYGVHNSRKALGRCMTRIAQQRRDAQIAIQLAKGEESAVQTKLVQDIFARLAAGVVQHLETDTATIQCNRRGQLSDRISEACRGAGLQVSGSVAREVVKILVQAGAISSKGRHFKWCAEQAAQAGAALLAGAQGTNGISEQHPPTPRLRPTLPGKARSSLVGISAAELSLLENEAKARVKRRKARADQRRDRKSVV